MARLTPDSAQSFVLAEVDSAFAQDPYPDFALLRDHAPVCRQPDGSFVVTRYDDVRAVLTDASRFSSDKKLDFRPKFGDSPLYEHHTTSLVFSDPPSHTRVRRLLAPFFTAQTLRRMEARIAAMVDSLLDRAMARGGVLDVVHDFAVEIPLNMVGDMLGVPAADREPLHRWATVILGGLEPVRTAEQLAAGNRAVEEFKDYLRELIAFKRRRAVDNDESDILWTLVQAHDAVAPGEEGLTELEILHNCIFMLNAGHDTTSSLLANGVDLLLRFPDQRKRLCEDRRLLRLAIEEMLRMESPLQIGNRRATTEVTLGDHRLAAGTFLHVVIASANRDERQFPNADRFDIGRDPNRHLAFGHGPHVCAGNALARLEATQAFGRLLDRFPDFERAGPTVRPDRSRFRLIEALPIQLC